MAKKFYYPVGKTKEEVDSKWYLADKFNSDRGTYFHSGVDWNLNTGGDSDLGQPLYAVGDGKIVYYHNSSHPNSGYGRHMVLMCETPFGIKWFHYAHCQEIITDVKEVKAGDIIGKLGKSGTKYAHLHFSVFHKDPKDHPKGIDLVDTDAALLDEYLEDPIKLLDKLWDYDEEEKTILVKISEFEGLRTKADALDKFVEAGYKSVVDVVLTLETNEERIKSLKDGHRQFLIDLINILDPESVLPELPDDDWVKTLAKQVVNKFSQMQSDIKSQKLAYEKSTKEIVTENKLLSEEVESLKLELDSLREQYSKNTEELKKQHTIEIEELKKQQTEDFNRLEKRINTVSTNVDVNKERREENQRVGNFIIELFNKLFKKEKNG